MKFDGLLDEKDIPKVKTKAAPAETTPVPAAPTQASGEEGYHDPVSLSIEEFKGTMPTVVTYADSLIAEAEAIKKISTAEDDEKAVAVIAKSKKAIAALENKKKGDRTYAMARAFIDSANAWVRTVAGKFESVEAKLKPLRDQYRRQQEIDRQAKEAQARKDAEKLRADLAEQARVEQERLDREAAEENAKRLKEAETTGKPAELVEAEKIVTPDVPDLVVPQTGGVVRTEAGSAHDRKTWVCDVINEDAVPREYCSPDKAKLAKAVKDGVRAINGCNIREKTIDVYR